MIPDLTNLPFADRKVSKLAIFDPAKHEDTAN